MSTIAKTCLAGAVLVFGPLFTASVSAQSSDPEWLNALQRQLASELQCEANYFLNIQEGQLGANRYYEARVQCVDGRMFDASRTEPDEQFSIRPCGVQVC